ncbi:hypothetical protein TcG_13116 [Trypanosoma cruzi]|nr:hypothetical protein TcG_13116 [Trypanosoma cruzi]
MECHDGTVSCGWWNIYFPEATKRELLLLLASLLPFVASHADYCLSADHGWHAPTSDVVCRHFTAPVKHTSRRMLWLWMWCRELQPALFCPTSFHCIATNRCVAARVIHCSSVCCTASTILSCCLTPG